MELKVNLYNPYCADGKYYVTARGYMVASLNWADQDGPLADWTALAHLPLDVSGMASFSYIGGRAIPPGVTHVAAKLISADFQRQETLLAPLPAGHTNPTFDADTTFAVMSDLHTAAKPGRIRRALGYAAEADCVLLPGDLTNDATPEQFGCLWQLIEKVIPNTPLLAVCGNHDFPIMPLPMVWQNIDHYYAFQEKMLNRAVQLGVCCMADESGAYSATFRGIEIHGLNAVSHWRRFTFPEGKQLDWLKAQLSTSTDRRIVLCHAPLIKHNPQRNKGEAAYLSRDAQLQQIIDGAGNVIFLSGHTHISLNEMDGCIENDAERGNLYLNDSSITPTMPSKQEILADREWADGAVCYLLLNKSGIEIKARCLSSGKWIARGYYRYGTKEGKV